MLLITAPLLATLSFVYGDDELVSPERDKLGRLLPRGISIADEHTLQIRQNPSGLQPPTTNVPICDQYNNYFYITPRNYTWQLQCTTNYEGTVIQQIDAANYSACIVSCADYNRASTPGACIGITFNGPDDSSVGLCTQFSTVTNLLLAYEEGNIQDSALLVRSPNGTVFATPRPAVSFSGQPSQPPTVVPLPSTSVTDSTTVVFTTSVITVTSCPPGVPSCPLLSPSSATTVPASASSPLSPLSSISVPISLPSSTSTAPISISDGGTRPGSPTRPGTITTPTNIVGGQATFTDVVTYTVFGVQAVALCPPTPGPCTQTSSTSTSIGYRTQLSCAPGVCTGIVIASNAVADVAAATCIEPA